ncbi:MAG: VOC family protein [Yoonia sp.]|uniref:VOC family protein n=1 Tax=Yoonia sp. TaxID=2212373 RepID=UPI003EF7AE82
MERLPVKLDHLAVACTSLDAGTAWVEDQLGVTMQAGGQHPRYGTHNTLLGLADGIYLEVIAKDPDAVPEAGHSWFGLDDVSGPPRLANWICQTTDIAQAPDVAGPPRALTRGDLAWQITVPDDGSLPMDGGFPTLIAWGRGTRHPSQSLSPSGCRLVRFEVTHPAADEINQLIALDDKRLALATGPLAMKAVFDTPNGQRVLE